MEDLRKPLVAFSGRRPSQIPFELRSFIKLMRDQGVKRYLEIGSREGDTFVEVLDGLGHGLTGVAVDLPGGLWGKETTRGKLERAVRHLSGQGHKASCLFGDSKTDATRRLVVCRGPYDAILIDGDHTLPGVCADWLAYGKMARIVAFHDIVGHGQAEKVHGNPVEVPKFWSLLKLRADDCGFECLEFVEEGSAMGIGVVIHLGEERQTPDVLEAFR